jgi:ATP-dependent DNA helicase PIF1
MGKLRYYAIAVGRDTGIFDSWKDVKPLVHGYSKPDYKAFDTRVQAEAWLLRHRPSEEFEEAAASPAKRTRLDGLDFDGSPARGSHNAGGAPGCKAQGAGGPPGRTSLGEGGTPERFSERTRLDEGGTPERAQIGRRHPRGGRLPQRSVFDQEEVKLDKRQSLALQLIMDGKNVLLSGCGGTGKSVVLHHAKKALREAGRDCVMTAPTGCAALNVDGQTLHSFFSCGVPNKVKDLDKMWAEPVKERLRQLHARRGVLFLDEVSMVQPELLDWLSAMMQGILQQPGKVFGGLQLVFSGDALQLGPIPGDMQLAGNQPVGPADGLKRDAIPLKVTEFSAQFFQSETLRCGNFYPLELSRVYRQSDQDLVEALRKVRRGVVDADCIDLFGRQLARDIDSDSLLLKDGARIEPTRLFVRNADVDSINSRELARLPDHRTYAARDFPIVDLDDKYAPAQPPADAVLEAADKLEKDSFWGDCHARKNLELAVGATVMLLQNIPRGCEGSGLVNGSVGSVVSYASGAEELLRLDAMLSTLRGKTDPNAFIIQRLEWQIEAVEMDLEDNPAIEYPRVAFKGKPGSASEPVELTILPTIFEKTVYMRGSCRRVQLPLRLAWAMTIHKAQGASLDCVTVFLEGCARNPGQAYGALSRCKYKDRLQVKGFHTNVVVTDPLAVRFADALSAASDLEQEAGRQALAAFVNSCQFWMQPLLAPAHAAWLPLFCTSDLVCGWLSRHCGYTPSPVVPSPAAGQVADAVADAVEEDESMMATVAHD